MSYNFTQVSWLGKANIYEVNIRQYTPEGTFTAFKTHIPRLKEMGVSILWLMPIYPIGELNRKGILGSYYSIQNFTAINPEFGNLNDFKALVSEAHKHGMKVMLDWVANHTSWDHDWMTEHPEFYVKNEKEEPFSPYDWTDVVQLDHSNETQVDTMIKAMEYWVKETHIDGFRCDMAHLVPLHFWKKARQQCNSHKPLLWLAETQDVPYFEVFDLIYGWEWLHKMEDYYKGKTDIYSLDTVVQCYYNDFKENKFRVLFTSNHDENSWQGTEYDRLGDASLAFSILCTTIAGVPVLYSGQEEPLTQKLNFFEKDDINFQDYKLHDFYKKLYHFKSTNSTLDADPSVTLIKLNTSENDKVLAYLRKKDNHEVLIIAHLSNISEMSVQLTDSRLQGKFKGLMDDPIIDFFEGISLKINAWTVLIYEKIMVS
jgi:alpha-amylase